MTKVENTEPADQAARFNALDPSQSFAVAAPAGSGKTSLLTQRVLKLLATCQSPEEVLCITFTRKAAGEMQDRISAAIRFAHENPRPQEAHQQLTWDLSQAVLARDEVCNWHLLKAPNRLRVLTIDGFCRALTRQLPLASGLGAQPETIDQAEDAYRQAVRALLAELEKESSLSQDLYRLLEHLDNNTSNIENLLVSLLHRREQWLPLMLASRHSQAREWLEGALCEVITTSLDKAANCLQSVASDLAQLGDYAGNNLNESAPTANIAQLAGIDSLPPSTVEALPQWHALLELLLKKDHDWRKQITAREGFPAGKSKQEKAERSERKQALMALIAELQNQSSNLSILQQLRSLPKGHYSDEQWLILDCLTRVLLHLVAELKVVFRNLGATDFSEITQAALLALGDEESPGDIALRLDYQIQHILVDEFQDTAQPQLELLQALTRGWQNDDGRSLFIVGDGMQSCYGFRQANVGIFLQARKSGIGGIPLESIDLSVNFRSEGGVVDWVNRVFSQAFPQTDDIARGAVKYSSSEAFKLAADAPAVKCLIASGENAKQDEAQAVVELVKQAQQEQPDNTIAILVRSRTHLRETLASLSEHNIPWQATDIDPLSSRMAIIDLLSLTRALLYPDNRIAWLSVLRSPWCGLNNHDLLKVATANLDEQAFIWENLQNLDDIEGLSADAIIILTRVQKVLSQALLQKRRKNLRHWVQGTWLALGGAATLLDPVDRDNADTFFQLLAKHSHAGRIDSWENFVMAIERLYAAPKTDANTNLQVMTIHKSKGLEFDTVIIPGLDRKPRQDDKSLLLWKDHINSDGSNGLLLGPLSPTGEESDPIYKHLAHENTYRNELENTRLLYVGCTRAAKKLYLLACLSENQKETEEALPLVQFKPPTKSCLLASIWPAVKHEVTAIPTASRPEQNNAEPEQNLHKLLRLPTAWNMPRLTQNNLLQAYRGREFEDDENLPSPDTSANKSARKVGNVLHRSLQQVVKDHPDQWNTPRIERQTPFWQMQLRQSGLNSKDAELGSLRIKTALERMLADPAGRWLLDPGHDESACELAIWHRTRDQSYQSGMRESIIDRTFVAAAPGSDENYRWIVDYKSSEPSTEQSFEDFLQHQREEYRSQLQRYADLMYSKSGPKIKTALYFPMLRHLEVLDLNDNQAKRPNNCA